MGILTFIVGLDRSGYHENCHHGSSRIGIVLQGGTMTYLRNAFIDASSLEVRIRAVREHHVLMA